MSWWRRLLRREEQEAHEAQLDKELRFHIEEGVADLRRSGLSEDEARRKVRQEFGGMDQVKDACRDARGTRWIKESLQHVRYACRSLRKSPGFATATVLTMALGIGITASLFSVIYAVLLRPLPYVAPDRLMVVWTDDIKHQNREMFTTYSAYREWVRQTAVFDESAFCTPNSPVTMRTPGGAERVDAVFASSGLFKVAGTSPLLGRVFSVEEERTGHGVVLSHSAWQRFFGGARDVLGKSIAIDEKSAVVIGVMPPSFQLPSSNIQFWLPLGMRQPRGVVFGRLRPGATRAAAQNELNLVAERLRRENPEVEQNPDHTGFRANVVPLSQQVTGLDVQRALWVLFAATLFLLLIGCANVANLLIARATARQQEFAVRAALGAGRGALVRQLVTESAVTACLGGALGLMLAVAILRVLKGSGVVTIARFETVVIDSSVLIFALALSILCGIGFGAYPAIHVSRVELNSVLRDDARGQTGGRTKRSAQRLLVIAQFALTLILLCGAGLMIRSLIRLDHLALGFRPHNVLAFRVVVPDAFSKEQRTAFHNQLLERLRALPGVTNAGVMSNLFSARNSEATIQIEGRRPVAMAVGDEAISDGLLSTLGSRIRMGRDFTARDHASASRIAIVNERFVHSILSIDQDAVGTRMKFLDGRYPSSDPWITIVGVVEDIRRDGLEREPFPQVFTPLGQNPSRGADFLIRSESDPRSLVPEIRRQVASLQPATPVYRVTTLESRLDSEMQPRRLQTVLLMLFAGAALFLAGVGMYAVLQYLVSQRTREIGVRIAMGASAASVVVYVLKDVLRLLTVGLFLGIAASLFMARVMQSMLFGVSSADSLAFAGAVIVLTIVALVAGMLPAIHAARLSPVDALRG
jgi:putative ABC transport system permease protein